MTEEDITDETPSQSKTPLIIGIAAGVVVLGIVIFLVVSSGDEKVPSEESREFSPAEEASVDTKPSEPEEKPPEWIVDQQVKTEVEELLRSLKDAEKNTEDYQKLRLALNDKHKQGVTAMIELINHAEEAIVKEVLDQLEWRTGMAYDRAKDGKPLPFSASYEKWKKWWLAQSATFNLPDKSEQLSQPIVVKGSKTPKKQEFKVNETLKAKIEPWLKEMRRLTEEEIRETKDRIIAKGDEVIPILIVEIGSEDEWIARYASDLLIEITKREDAPNINPLIPYESRLVFMEEWKEWWRENQDK